MRHLCLLVLTSAVAFGQVKPPIAPYPLDVLVRGVTDAQVKELQAESRRLLGLEATLPDGLALDAAMTLTTRKDCDADDACLAEFARNAKSLYALYVTVESDAKQKQLTAKGRAVRDDGVLVVALKSVTVTRKPKEPVDVGVREALKELFAAMKLGTLVPTRDVVVKKDPEPIKPPPEPVKILPDPPPVPLVPVDTGAGQRMAGTALLIGGGGVAVIGAVMSFAGCGIGCGVTKVGDALPEGELDKARTGRTLLTVGFTGVGVGVAAAAVGAVVLAIAPAAPVTNISVMPVAGGGVVQLGGQF